MEPPPTACEHVYSSSVNIYGATLSNQRKEKISPSLFIHQFTVWVSTSTLKPWVIFIIINLPFVKGPLIAVAAARTFAWISQVNINMWPLHVFQEPPKTAQCLMIDNKRACRKWKPPSFIFMNSMSFWLSMSRVLPNVILLFSSFENETKTSHHNINTSKCWLGDKAAVIFSNN